MLNYRQSSSMFSKLCAGTSFAGVPQVFATCLMFIKGAVLFKNRFFWVFCFLIDLDQQFNADSKYLIIFLKFQLIAS